MGGCIEKTEPPPPAKSEEELRQEAAAARRAARAKERAEAEKQKALDEEAMKTTKVFGVSAKLAAERSDPNKLTPTPIAICMDWLQRNGLDAEGLFRIPGSIVKVNEYKRKFNLGEYNLVIPDDESVENVASIIIRFLNEVTDEDGKKTTIGGKPWDAFCQGEFTKLARKNPPPTRSEDEEKMQTPLKPWPQGTERIKEELLKLDPINSEVFRRIVVVLKEASETPHSDHNMMTPKKFALCTLPANMNVVETMIERYDEIYPLQYPAGPVVG